MRAICTGIASWGIMTKPFYADPIANSPYRPPTRHHALDDEGQPLDSPPVSGRRTSKYLVPVPRGRRADTKGIAALFIDTDYNEESFFVRHAYFLGANDPYKSLKTALKAEIDGDAWATLYSDTSRPFARPATGRIAVKVINHFGDEVLKVFGV